MRKAKLREYIKSKILRNQCVSYGSTHNCDQASFATMTNYLIDSFARTNRGADLLKLLCAFVIYQIKINVSLIEVLLNMIS